MVFDKRGLKRFFLVFFREFSGLVGLNLVFLLSCLPVVTLGPALSAFGWVLGGLPLVLHFTRIALSGRVVPGRAALSWGIALHLFPLLSDPTPPAHPLRAAGTAVLHTFRQTLLSILSALAFLVPQILLFPVTVPVTFLVGLVLPGLALAFPHLSC